ncbi:MAG TPA: cysteine desulfurase [Candidatus Aenigmarchaeota archaeon]|nr:cysteine desulfurase [Candidatus Aenigmarchaeota archaeon]
MNVNKIREDFPILRRKINGKPLIYFDNTATSQKPIQVINVIKEFYEQHNANIHRGVHTLSQEASEMYEEAHNKVAKFINARRMEEIIFVRNATEAINLVAYSWGMNNLKEGDEIVVTVMEHHSNIIPWQFLEKKKGIILKFVDINNDGTLKMEEYEKLITERTKLVTVTHVSNVLGTINDVAKIGKLAHEVGALFLVDGAQSVPHMPVDVRKIDADFLAFSGHKMLAPTGIGVLYGKEELLQRMEPFLGGGDMIHEVWLHKATYNTLPWKFEAGTANIAGGVGLAAAVDYLEKIGMENVREHEKELTEYALKKMKIENIDIYGPLDVKIRGGVISFNVKDLSPHDVAALLDEHGIAVRSGHHCAQPLMRRLGVKGTARASFYIYNTKEEIDIFVETLEKIVKLLV